MNVSLYTITLHLYNTVVRDALVASLFHNENPLFPMVHLVDRISSSRPGCKTSQNASFTTSFSRVQPASSPNQNQISLILKLGEPIGFATRAKLVPNKEFQYLLPQPNSTLQSFGFPRSPIAACAITKDWFPSLPLEYMGQMVQVADAWFPLLPLEYMS